MFRRKPKEVIKAEEETSVIERHLNLFDCIMLGIGTTVGTGVFATAADIIREFAGPAAAISWTIAGCACLLNGIAYMELSANIPSAGSCYAYSYVALGELPAFVAGWLLTLEYGLAGSGVATSWAIKVQEVITTATNSTNYEYLNADYCNFLAAGLHAVVVLLLLAGFRLGKLLVNAMTMLKVIVIFFMIIVGFIAMTPSNYDPFIPGPSAAHTYGFAGVMLGATRAFFGYIGFDEVCCLAAETKNPRRTLPLSVLGVIVGTCFLSASSSLALAGLQNYSIVTSFPAAFRAAGYAWAGVITSVGEISTMPVVVLISFLAQPRLQYAMAADGLLPPIFKELNAKGEIFWGTLICGIVFTIVALLIPFRILWDMVNFGILFSFNMTNSSLVLIRTSPDKLHLARSLQGAYVVLIGAAAFTLQCGIITGSASIGMWCLFIFFALVAIIVLFSLWKKCPQQLQDMNPIAPAVPFSSGAAIAVNWFLISQLPIEAIGIGILWVLAACISYFIYGYRHSTGKNGWKELLRGSKIDQQRPSAVYKIEQEGISYENNLETVVKKI